MKAIGGYLLSDRYVRTITIENILPLLFMTVSIILISFCVVSFRDFIVKISPRCLIVVIKFYDCYLSFTCF